MGRARANGIEIEYETFGDRSAEPLLLIMGLGSQMIFWDEEFCEMLAERGHFVIRFDNRDVGLSTRFDHLGVPNIPGILMAALKGERPQVPYTLEDMADDSVGLLDAIGIEQAHICGASMGGMIAQTLAVRHPQRVKSLISIMSTTGEPGLPPPRPDVLQLLMTPVPTDREGFIERSVNLFRTIGSPGFPFEEERVRRRAARSYERGLSPAGQARQFAAILVQRNRRGDLGRLRIPALVIHGTDDPLVPVEGGKATAAAIPGAKLLLVPGMGHDNPRPVWPQAVAAITEVTREARGFSQSQAASGQI